MASVIQNSKKMVKIILYISYFLFIHTISFSQANDSLFIVFGEIEESPKYKNSYSGLLQFIETNIQYPIKALEDSIEGIVYVSFIVDTNGSTSDHKILKGIREDIDNEALRVIKLLIFEKPATLRGKPIKYEYLMPINFIINNKIDFKKKNKHGFP